MYAGAVEEYVSVVGTNAFMEFVESNAKGKMPIHPSYLELKRLLLDHAEFRSGDSEVAQAKARLSRAASANDDGPQEAAGQANPTAIALAPVIKKQVQRATAVLPPQRKAAN